MCLVLLAFQARKDTGILLAGNRDELHSRPSAPPAIVHADPPIYAGKDLEGGGTWMGRNAHGMMAALTNRHTLDKSVPPDVRSRGEIVLTLLQHTAPERAAEWLASLPVEKYRPFNVLFGNPHRFYFFASGERLPPRELLPGCYALSNSTLDDRSWPKVGRALDFLERTRDLPGEELLVALQDFLGDATPPDEQESPHRSEEIHGVLGAVFIRSPGYGTVSSSILTAGGKLGERYYFAEGEALGEDPRGAFRRVEFPA
jgi:uncharacterized protein with NRDE domain